MKFADALELLKQGEKVKLPGWSGYWVKEDNTVKMYCKDGRVLDIRETEDVFYTLSNIASEEWCVAEDKEINLDVHTFMFGEAIRRLKAGQKVARKGWNGKGLFIQKEQIDDIQSFFTITDTKTGRKNTWVPSISDLFAEDWVFVEQ